MREMIATTSTPEATLPPNTMSDMATMAPTGEALVIGLRARKAKPLGQMPLG